MAANSSGSMIVPVGLAGLAMMSRHTFRVTAVTANGTESAAGEPVSVSVYIPGMQPQCPPAGPVRTDYFLPNLARMAHASAEEKAQYAGPDAGCVRVAEGDIVDSSAVACRSWKNR